jgi:HD-GYP domain-containing protein (c-di-GMP phosphodiesterase class II)
MTPTVKNPDPFARQLQEAIAAAAGTAKGSGPNGNRVATGTVDARTSVRTRTRAVPDRDHAEARRLADARRIATKVGRGMLEASTSQTAEHSDDVVVISGAICDLLEIHGEERQELLAAAKLHDIGKAAVPREILEKPGALNDEEWKVMRTHTIVGGDILASVPELNRIAKLVRHSHERWDGGGYPDGLAGEDIPLGSRIIFCADTFDAIRADRPYRAGRPAAEALAEIRRHAGTQFDPDIVEALVQVTRELKMSPPPAGARVRRSNRLMALLLTLALGVSGSAVARSGLLGAPEATAAGTSTAAVAAEQCDPFSCGWLPGGPLTADLLGGADAGGAAFLSGPGALALGGPGSVVLPGGAVVTPGGAKDDSGSPADPSAPGAKPESAPGQSGDAPGNSGNPAPGNSGNNPQGGPPGHNRPSGGSPGNSGNPAPGNSGNNPHGGPPGHNGGGGPGNSGGGGNSGGSPGNSGGAPGNSGNAPGQSGSPGNSGSAGNSGSSGSSAPGNSGGNPHGGPPGQGKPPK